MTTTDRIAEIRARLHNQFVKWMDDDGDRFLPGDSADGDLEYLLDRVAMLEKVAEAAGSLREELDVFFVAPHPCYAEIFYQLCSALDALDSKDGEGEEG